MMFNCVQSRRRRRAPWTRARSSTGSCPARWPAVSAPDRAGGSKRGRGCRSRAAPPCDAWSADGQPLAATLADYALARARDPPAFALGHTATPSPLGGLGAKGHGEAGAISSPPAVVAAVADALRALGVAEPEPPLTPARVWAAIRAAGGAGVGRGAEQAAGQNRE